MNRELKQRTKEWMSLERRTLEQRRVADEYYESNMMKLIEQEFIQNNRTYVYEKVKYLVISVGTSYEPIVLTIGLLKPLKILFLYTDQSEKTLEKIVSYCNLGVSQYEKSQVNEVDPMDIYREIKKVYIKWDCPEQMYIDFTGGTKAMSAACALAGAMIDIQMIYVSTDDYLVDFRKPNPGSEHLTYIENPIAVFGDIEMNKALELFSQHNFAGARERLDRLKEQIPDPEIRQQLKFLYLLAKGYEYWDALDFVPASETIDELNREISRDKKIHKEFILVDLAEKISTQNQILKNLAEIPVLQEQHRRVDILKSDQRIHSLMFTMFQNALTREAQQKYDMATLLFYRLLEMIEQRRLVSYDIDVSDPDYEHVRYDLTQAPEFDVPENERAILLRDKNNQIKKCLFKTIDVRLPVQIALLDGYILLAALKDPITTSPDENRINTLKRIRHMVYLRNNSIFAHGLGPVSKQDFKKFRDFVEELFISFCKIEKINFNNCLTSVRWIDPHDSKNFLKGWET